jgi:hypothetical protein
MLQPRPSNQFHFFVVGAVISVKRQGQKSTTRTLVVATLNVSSIMAHTKA